MNDGPTRVSLEDMKVRSVGELLELPTDEIVRRLERAPFPPSEKVGAAVLLVGVDNLRKATEDVAQSSRDIATGTGRLILLARLALGVAVVSLAVSLVAALS